MKRLLLPAALALLFLLALGIRLFDLTDPPTDFHPTRQWRAALIARGMYYQALESAPDPERSIAVAQWHGEAVIEPPVLEWMASRLYLLAGGEQLWFARLLSAVFWLLGGAAVFLLARDLSGAGGGLAALAYFFFLPYAMLASRSFQPDPLMVALMAWAFLFLHRWAIRPSLPHAIGAGAFAGLAILVKAVAVFPLGMAAVTTVLAACGFRKALRDRQVWTIAALSLLPGAAYYVNGLFLAGFMKGQGSYRFFVQMWADPAFYIRWVEMATDICGLTVLLAGLAGIFLVRERRGQALLAGMWLGYLVYGFVFPYHFITHDYYQLPLIAIAAVSLAPAAGALLDLLGQGTPRRLGTVFVTVLALGVILFKAWDTRVILLRQDYRSQPAEWSRFRDLVPPGASVLALSQAYGYLLAYYGWLNVEPWLTESDLDLRTLSGQTEESVQARQLEQLAGAEYFVITNFNEFDRQPALQRALYDNFPVYREGQGYLIFDLQP